MKCKQAQSQFIDYVEGTLATATKTMVDDHLVACSRCRDELRAIEEASGWLTEAAVRLQETLAPSAALYSAIAGRLQEAPPRISPPQRIEARARQLVSILGQRGIRLAAAAAMLVVMAIAVSYFVGVPLPGVSRLTPQKALAKAYAAMAEVKSYHVTMTTTVTEGSDQPETSYDGDFLLPDRRWMLVSYGGVPHHEDIWIGSTWYMRPMHVEKWYRAGLPSGVERWMFMPLGLTPVPLAEGQPLTPDAMSDFVASLEGLVKRPGDIIDGMAMEHYKGILNIPAYVTRLVDDVAEREASIEYLREKEAKWAVEVWVSKNDGLVRQMRIDRLYKRGDGTLLRAVSLSKFSDFNKPVQIEPPM